MVGESNSLINQHMGNISEVFGSGKEKGSRILASCYSSNLCKRNYYKRNRILWNNKIN